MSEMPSPAIATTMSSGQNPAPGDLGLPTPNPQEAVATGIARRIAPTPSTRSTVMRMLPLVSVLLLHRLADLLVHRLQRLAEVLAVEIRQLQLQLLGVGLELRIVEDLPEAVVELLDDGRRGALREDETLLVLDVDVDSHL